MATSSTFDLEKKHLQWTHSQEFMIATFLIQASSLSLLEKKHYVGNPPYNNSLPEGEILFHVHVETTEHV